MPGAWHIDVAVVRRRLSEISNHSALRAAGVGTRQASAQGEVDPEIAGTGAAKNPSTN